MTTPATQPDHASQSMWVVQRLMTQVGLAVQGQPIEQFLPLTVLDGMVGALPVFATKEQAEAYANGALLIEIRRAN